MFVPALTVSITTSALHQPIGQPLSTIGLPQESSEFKRKATAL